MKRFSFIHTVALLGLAGVAIGAVLLVMGKVGNPQTVGLSTLNSSHVAIPFDITLGTVLFFIAALLVLVAWIAALVYTAREHQWIWFVVLLLLIPVGLFIYSLAEPGSSKTALTSARRYAR